ncbi:MAG: single-stranded-DNA-specific exonuclease RecJ [Anaerolineae bacterium]|nr:single-stranded-DNA-specific exonuclease RecJ [Anaerolineae bacterium]
MSPKEWIEPSPVEISPQMLAAAGGHLLLAQLLTRRGITDAQTASAFLDPARYRPTPADALPHIERAAARLEQAIRHRERICVWGDFDVDGQTATTILVSTLRALGAQHLSYYIPHRERESHGVNLATLERLIADGMELLLTCDTGITAHEPVAYAASQGVEVIITDHHDLPPRLPAAYAIINPKMLPADHPLRHLPGVGVAYKLAEALYTRADRTEEVEQYLDLVALGIVADVVTLQGDTRYLLQRGIGALRCTARPGLQALLELAGISPERLCEEHIAFELAPRLNAMGRLDDATAAVEFLAGGDPGRARAMAAVLEGLNAQRKWLCDQVMQAAEARLAQEPALLEEAVLILSHPSWPAGIIGVVAGRLAERYHKPTILIATPPGAPARGSARSIEGCDIHAAIAAHAEMLLRFGGHPMAAGFSIDPERIPEFRRALTRTVAQMCQEMEKRATLQIDAYLSLAALSLELAEQLERMAPFGPGNPPPVFATRNLVIKSHSPVGRTGEHLQLIVEDEDETTCQVIWWQGAGFALPQDRFDLAYTIRASDYRGKRGLQVEWVDAREEAASTPRLEPSVAQVRVVDYRQCQDGGTRERLLAQLQAQKQDELVLWAEAEARVTLAGRDRCELAPANALAIWTTPPGPAELRAALERVSPHEVYLFCVNPGTDEPGAFLKRLGGLIKHALSSGEMNMPLAKLAAATAQREATVRVGLQWLAARGLITFHQQANGELRLTPACDQAQESEDVPQLMARLRSLLEETAAYRAFLQRVDVSYFRG